ncbi:MAG: hypothetical protein KKB59_19050 [Spirochaetes bacterium]|nr:hypothetical protein [Spirochaetota bacterium]
MDISERYINMCRGAEIQKNWNKTIGDYYSNILNKVSIIFYGYIRCEEREWYGGTYNRNELILDSAIWLPRQDQLQGMLILSQFKVTFLDRFCKFAKSNWYDSMEQLWLAFVMQEKYNKVWDGEWIEG